MLTLACALVAALAAPPGATSSVDVSTGLNGMLIESRGDSRSTVVIEESDRFFTGSAAAPRPAGATTYLVRGEPCEPSRNLVACARVKPRHLLCEPFAFSAPIVCPRTSLPQATAPGVRVRFGGGDDRLAFGRVPDAPGSCRAGHHDDRRAGAGDTPGASGGGSPGPPARSRTGNERDRHDHARKPHRRHDAGAHRAPSRVVERAARGVDPGRARRAAGTGLPRPDRRRIRSVRR